MSVSVSLFQCCAKCAGSAVPHLSGDVAKLAFPKLWTSLEVTFLYEHHLLELRHIAFEGKSHLCESCYSETPCVSEIAWPDVSMSYDLRYKYHMYQTPFSLHLCFWDVMQSLGCFWGQRLQL